MRESSLGFCNCEFGHIPNEESLFRVIPAPLEKSVSYGGGTKAGPEAILAASEELEPVYLGTVPGEAGIEVAPPVNCDLECQSVLDQIGLEVFRSLDTKKVPIVLGGEHTVTYGAYSGIKRFFSNDDIGIIQIDAHADLRDQYQGNPLSHACVMRRISEQWNPRIHQIGVRGISKEEFDFRNSHPHITFQDAPELWKQGLSKPFLPDDFPAKVYLTFDVDGLDASLMPSTGTPSPGGLFWHQVETILEELVRDRELIGFDLVELAPCPQFNSPDFTAAVAVYAGMWAVCEGRENNAIR